MTRALDLVVIADLDKQSKSPVASNFTHFSYLQHGTLTVSPRRDAYTITWTKKQQVSSEVRDRENRGFELSELAWFQGQLLTFDDRTGVVFQLVGFSSRSTTPLQAIEKHTITAGDGETAKGQKHEWATVKDGELYMGSNGTTNRANEWVAILDAENTIRHADWATRYESVRTVLGIHAPGYVVHEAVEWSAVHNKWFLLPRRVSPDAFDPAVDGRRGANKLVIASDDFSDIEVVGIRGLLAPERGFSSFKFVPNTEDSVIMAIKSVELGETQASYLTVFDIQGRVLLEDTPLPGSHKYEGVAFAQDWASTDAEEATRAPRCCGFWW